MLEVQMKTKQEARNKIEEARQQKTTRPTSHNRREGIDKRDFVFTVAIYDDMPSLPSIILLKILYSVSMLSDLKFGSGEGSGLLGPPYRHGAAERCGLRLCVGLRGMARWLSLI